MKKLIAFAMVFLAALLVSCGKPKQTLHVFIWGNYISPEVVEQFERENDCEVVLDVFDSNESMYNKIKAGANGYDVIVPSAYMAKLMHKQGMLEELDHSKLPNAMKFHDRVYSRLALDGGMVYTVPYFVSITGIGYDSEKLKDFEPTWRQFERQDIAKRCTMLDDSREVIGCALRTLGYDVNTADKKQIDEAVALARSWKKNIAKYAVDDAVTALANGSFIMIQTYSGDMLQASMECPSIRFVIPKEGTTVTFDCFAIMKTSTNKDLAHEFINFMYRTDIAVKNMNEISYIMPHKEAVKQVKDSLKKNPIFNISMDDLFRCYPLRDMEENQILYTDAWDRIKAE